MLTFCVCVRCTALVTHGLRQSVSGGRESLRWVGLKTSDAWLRGPGSSSRRLLLPFVFVCACTCVHVCACMNVCECVWVCMCVCVCVCVWVVRKYLGYPIRVVLDDKLCQLIETRRPGLHHEEDFGILDDLTFPGVDGRNPWHDCDTRR